ncbi:MAG: hypothetical protein K8S62_09535 [Candidatus Sabulitectum sp.]|nr:hypothetical protein [Candidatus Sabulitectum sp.]
MLKQSARFHAGHFFRTVMLSLTLWAAAGCDDNMTTRGNARELTETGELTVLIQFAGTPFGNSMPEAVADFPSTAGGRFHAAQVDFDCFHTIIEAADNAGKLLMVIIPEGEQFSGSRDHLVICIDSRGIPAEVSPFLNSDLFTDSLWEDPVVRQQTILDLVAFFKPDMVFQFIQKQRSSPGVTQFWSEHGTENNTTVAIYASPAEDGSYRGWGIFTGKGIRNGLLEGLDVPGFTATVKMISGMDWNNNGHGYPAMQAFYATETE